MWPWQWHGTVTLTRKQIDKYMFVGSVKFYGEFNCFFLGIKKLKYICMRYIQGKNKKKTTHACKWYTFHMPWWKLKWKRNAWWKWLDLSHCTSQEAPYDQKDYSHIHSNRTRFILDPPEKKKLMPTVAVWLYLISESLITDETLHFTQPAFG